MKKYREHIKKHWYCFLLAPIFMTLEAAGEFILPFINANIIDQGAASGDIPYILENGVIKMEGSGEELLHSPEVMAAYLGEQIGAGEEA